MQNKLEQLKELRADNFQQIGQCMLQKKYYEEKIEELLKSQEELCTKIFQLERKN